MTGFPWPTIRATAKGNRKALQQVETLQRCGMPAPTGYSVGADGLAVTWEDGTGHRVTIWPGGSSVGFDDGQKGGS